MKNNFKKIYTIMSIIGALLGLGGGIYAVFNDITSSVNFTILISVLSALLIIIYISMIILNKSKNKSQGYGDINVSLVRGHLSLMLGVCILLSAVMFKGGTPFSDALVIVIIVVSFMSVMLTFMLSTFAKIIDKINESEKE